MECVIMDELATLEVFIAWVPDMFYLATIPKAI